MLQWSSPAVGVIAIGGPTEPDGLRGPGGDDICLMDTLRRLGRGPVHRSNVGAQPAVATADRAGDTSPGRQDVGNRLPTAAAAAVVVADVRRLQAELETATAVLLGRVSGSRHAETRAS